MLAWLGRLYIVLEESLLSQQEPYSSSEDSFLCCFHADTCQCFLQAQTLCYFAEKKQQFPKDIAGPLSVFHMHW